MEKIKLIFDEKFNEWAMSYPKEWYETRELFYNALELENKDEKESVKIYKRLLKKLPLSDLESYIYYGILLKRKKRIFEGKSLISRALLLAESSIPEKYYKNPVQINWYNHDNRPLLEAFLFAAIDCEEDGFYIKSKKLYKFILKANPNDNQGVRYLLTTLYLKQGDYNSFYQHYADNEDTGVDGEFGFIFADFKTNKIDLARKKLTEFSINYPLLIKEILKKQHAEPDSLAFRLGAESPRSSEEAYNYYQRSDVLWKNNPEFVKFIKSIK